MQVQRIKTEQGHYLNYGQIFLLHILYINDFQNTKENNLTLTLESLFSEAPVTKQIIKIITIIQ